MVYAVDFDGTLAVTRFPEILEPRQKVIDYIKQVKVAGHKLILWTCRIDEDLKAAVEWCRQQGIEFDAVNQHLPEQLAIFPTETRKIWADVYVDDKSMGIEEIEGLMST